MSTRGAANYQVVFPRARQVLVAEQEVRPLDPKEVRIRTHRTLISTGTEVAHFSGEEWRWPNGTLKPQYPHYPGYSNAGVVVEVGTEVQSVCVGERVASGGKHSEFVTLDERTPMWRIPHAVSFDEATSCNLACTVLNGVRLGKPQLGDAVVVIGLGVLGQIACQLVRLFGARTIIGLDVDSFRLQLASRVGAASYLFDPAVSDVVGQVKDLTNGRGAYVVYEVTGLTQTYDLAFELARYRGRVVGLGSPRWPAKVDMMQVHMKALEVVGAIVSSHPPEGSRTNRWTKRANGELFMGLLAEGAVNVQDLITHRFPYARAADAYRMLWEKKEEFLMVILEWSE